MILCLLASGLVTSGFQNPPPTQEVQENRTERRYPFAMDDYNMDVIDHITDASNRIGSRAKIERVFSILKSKNHSQKEWWYQKLAAADRRRLTAEEKNRILNMLDMTLEYMVET